MVDPSLLGYALMGTGSTIVNRLVQRWFPTPLEKAQLTSIEENLKLARDRIAADEKRVVQELEARRELLLKQLEAANQLEQDRDLMRRWPLDVPAAAMVRQSRALAGGALNAVLVPVVRPVRTANADDLIPAMVQLRLAADALIDRIPRLLGDDVCYYRETEPFSNGAKRTTMGGQQLVATINALTSTEPTVLLQISVADRETIRVSWSCWGWSGDMGPPAPGTLYVPLSALPDRSSAEIEAALLVVICALNDQFQTLRSLGDPKPPRMFSLLSKLADVRFRADPADDEAATSDAASLLASSHEATLATIGEKAPLPAAEAAARAAIEAKALDRPDLAERFMAQAVELYRDAIRGTDEEGVLVAKLMERAFDTPRPLITRALLQVRELDPGDYVQMGGPITAEGIFARLDAYDHLLTAEQKKKLKDRLVRMMTFVPRIAVFGKSGVGKSSLCNAIFGRDVCPVNDVEACTRNPSEVMVELENDKGIVLLDVPGVGESPERDEEYRKLYKQLLPEVDLVLWVIKGDDRAFTSDLEFFGSIVKPATEKGLPFLFVLNQIDKVEPFREWNEAEREPGPSQRKNIARKVEKVAEDFKIGENQIAIVSAAERYGLTQLVDKIILSLPDAKRISVAAAISSQHISKNTEQKVKESTEHELASSLVPGAVNGVVIGAIIAGPIGAAIGGVVGALASWWARRK